jgi:GH25 family lysozyme M1 (1,4-beta-N-acetylmuramidase)
MTIFFPDVYSGQAGISFAGAPAVLVKATQGTGYVNADYSPAKTRAASTGTFFVAYHFLEAGNASAQASHAFAEVGKGVPLMVDFEPTTGSDPSVADAEGFIAEYRKLGGVTHLLYFPHWYWQQLGSPALSFTQAALVSSDYTAYSDSGPGWAAYGGLTPKVWQYTSSATFNGHNPVDMNAYKGTIAQFRELAQTGTVTAPPAPTGAYPAPVGAHVAGVSITVGWKPVVVAGKTVGSYSIRTFTLDGKVVASQTSPTPSALIGGLVHGTTYNIQIWANGGPVAPPGAVLKVTV